MDDTKKNRRDELDEFWDISSLLPQRKSAPAPYRPSTEPVEITIEPSDPAEPLSERDAPAPLDIPLSKTRPAGGDIAAPGGGDESGVPIIKKFIPPHTAEEESPPPRPDDEYEPRHNLIHRVRIFNWKTSYNYYEQFLRHAKKIKNAVGAECSRVPFFSYVPQFSQLNKSQLAWYLWWRERAGAGEYLRTDYSYILLFIYEIINTGGQGDPARGQELLFGIWRAYREEFPRFDKMLGEWICDFSLIHHLPPPEFVRGAIPAEALKVCNLKEFYMSVGEDYADGYCNMLLTYCSNYDYKSSKFAKGDALPIYDKHIRGALSQTIKRFSGDGGQLLSGAGLEDSRVIRDAFAGALCSYEVKRRIEVDYCSFSRTHELRFLVTDIIKYSENKIRASLGIKSRLGVYALALPMRECIDEYFSEHIPKKPKAVEPEARDYDVLYDTPPAPPSPGRAAEIEKASWETTERLIEAFAQDGGEEERELPKGEPPAGRLCERLTGGASEGAHAGEDEGLSTPASPAPPSISLGAALGDLFEFLRLADMRDYASQRSFAAKRGELPDLIADRINEIAFDILGDVILADEGEGYSLIEDYRKEVFDD